MEHTRFNFIWADLVPYIGAQFYLTQLLTMTIAFRDSTVVVIETGRTLIRAGIGLAELLKTPSLVCFFTDSHQVTILKPAPGNTCACGITQERVFR